MSNVDGICPMNLQLKDVSLFEKFKDPDEAADTGLSHILDSTDTGKVIKRRMDEICKWIPTAFDADKDPLWPKFSKVLVVPRQPSLWFRPASATSFRTPVSSPCVSTSRLGTTKSEIPFVPGISLPSGPGIFARTR